ncbi:MAG: ABC transporter [Aeromicrobium sp.]|nr:MAG: ABC transporter [Aeromicrobium sp.]
MDDMTVSSEPQAAAPDELYDALSALAAAVATVPFVLEIPGIEEARAAQRVVTDQLSDYVLPRLENLDAPLLVVVGGSTGSGKSTLVNSIVGKRVTETGVLRPTTRTPVLVHHPADTEWFTKGSLLPDFVRTGSNSRRANTVRQIACSQLWPGVAVLDAPDFDSIDESNREMAEQLLAAADLWLFVTSAARYADNVPWEHLRKAAERHASIAVVLDRTSPEGMRQVRRHLAQMLTEHGLSNVALFSVPESTPNAQGVLPAADVAQIVMWLRQMAADSQARREIVLSTLQGAIVHDIDAARRLAGDLDRQIVAADQLFEDVRRVYAESLDTVLAQASDGTMLRGEVLARWQEFVGSGEIFRSLEAKVGTIRDRLFVKRKSTVEAEDVEHAATTGLHLLILDQAERAAEASARTWAQQSAGRALLESHRGLDRASRDVRIRAERIAREWREAVFELVSQEGAGRKTKAKVLSYGVNATGVALMVVVFAGTAGLTGVEIGIAGGTAVAGQKLLEAVFGDQAMRELAKAAREDLRMRISDLFESEAMRYLDLLPNPEELRHSAWEIDRAIEELDEGEPASERLS